MVLLHKLYLLEIFAMARMTSAAFFLQIVMSAVAPVSPTTTSTIYEPDGMTITWFFLVCLFCLPE